MKTDKNGQLEIIDIRKTNNDPLARIIRKFIKDLKTNKKVLVLGLARSGKAAVELLDKLHASITVNEYASAEKIDCYDEYVSRGIEMVTGGHPEELFERDFDFVVRNRRGEWNKSTDMTMGPVANDQLYLTIRLYEQGTISAEAAIEMLKTHTLFDQLAIHTQIIADQLKFIESIEL